MKSAINDPLPYTYQQMLKVAPFPIGDKHNGQFKIQITSDKGKTNYLNITPEQFSEIERIINHGCK